MSEETSELAFQIHDLRSKAAAGLSFIELLQRESPDLEANRLLKSVQECLEGVIASSCELSQTVASFSVVANSPSPQSRKMTASAKDVVTRYAPDSYAALARQFPIEINFSSQVSEEDHWVQMEVREIASIRQNVVANAVAAGASKVDVCYEMKDYGLLITITDNGCGMTEDELNLLRLQQLGDGRVHGLGTRRILSAVNSQEAVVAYDSEPGVGTTVSILCPYVSGGEQISDADAALPTLGSAS